MSRRSKRGREDGEEEDDVDREVAAAVAAAVAEALPPPIMENGNMSIDVEEQASKLKEKRLFDMIDYEQEVILKLEGTEKQMRSPHFKIMTVRPCLRLNLLIYFANSNIPYFSGFCRHLRQRVQNA